MINLPYLDASVSAAEIAAAAKIMSAAYDKGLFVLDPVLTATTMLDAARLVRSRGFVLRSRSADGISVAEVEFLDRGDSCVGFDEHGNVFEALTSCFRSRGVDPGWAAVVSQVDRWDAAASGDITKFRSVADLAKMLACGIDLAAFDQVVPI